MFFKHFASKKQLPGLSVNGILVENVLIIDMEVSDTLHSHKQREKGDPGPL